MKTPAVTMVAAWMRQPGVQQELRRLAHGAHEQQEADHGQRIGIEPEIVEALADEVGRLREHGLQINRAGEQEHGKDAERKAEVADAVDQERLDRRGVCRRLVEPETDQQVACDADAFPAEEQLREVVRRHQHQHGEGKERQVAEEARLVWIVGHVADRIEMNERRYRRHHHQHHGGERIDEQRPIDLQVAGCDEIENRDMGVMPGEADLVKGVAGQNPGDEKKRGGDQLGSLRACARRTTGVLIVR
jgi:hypothetical protein